MDNNNLAPQSPCNALSEDIYQISQKILTNYDDLLSVKDLAKIFKVSKSTIRRELNAGKFGKPILIGREFKIPKIYIVNRFFIV